MSQREPDILQRYFRDAALIRLTMQYNDDDFHFVHQENGKIVYVFDANLVFLFLDPSGQHESVDLFHAGHHSKFDDGTSVVTAEWLFSGGLAGQHGLPAFITSDHSREVGNFVDRLMSALRRTSGGITLEDDYLSPEACSMLESSVAKVKEGSHPSQVAALINTLPRIVASLVKENIPQQLGHYVRLSEMDLLRPLALHEFATADVVDPSARLVAEWTQRIARERRRNLFGASAGARRVPERTTERDRRDAASIVKVLLMNQATAQQDQPVLHVLVTADRALYRAYSIWFYDTSDTSTKGPFALRHPYQYSPLLNLAEMGAELSFEDLFDRVRETIDGLFSFFLKRHPAYPHILAAFVSYAHRWQGRAVSEYDLFTTPWHASLWQELFVDGDPQELGRVIGIWRKASQSAVAAVPRLLEQRAREFEVLSALLLEHTSYERGIRSQLDGLLRRVDGAHVSFNVDEILSQSAKIAMGLSEQQTQGRAPRLPFLIRLEFPEYTSEAPLRQYVDQLFQGEKDASGMRRIVGELRKGDESRALGFAVCVAISLGLWEAVEHYGQRVVKSIDLRLRRAGAAEADDLSLFRYEILYGVAVALRFTMVSAKRFVRADSALQQSARFYQQRGDTFGLSRTRSERAALHLTFLYEAHAQGGNLGALDETLSAGLIERELDELLCMLDLTRFTADWDDRWERLALQASANFVSLDVFCRLFEGRVGAPAPNVRKARKGVIEGVAATGMELPIIVHVELALVDLMVEKDAGKREQRRIELGSLLQAGQEAKKGLSEMDRNEMKAISSKIFGFEENTEV